MSSEPRSPQRRGATAREQSFGGVVVRGDPATGGAEVIVIVPRGRRTLALPKGGASDGEAPERAAAREVREETGVTGALRDELGDVTYYYRRGGRRIRKTVRFFLFDYVEGSTDDHDHEVDEARWIPIDEARTALSYPGEREMVERAARVLADPGPDR
jgi:8-oxo-dGTP pyrophosphatase MutT (NUDIX family)